MSCFLAIDSIGLDSATYGQDSGVCAHVRAYRVVVVAAVGGGQSARFQANVPRGYYFFFCVDLITPNSDEVAT